MADPNGHAYATRFSKPSQKFVVQSEYRPRDLDLRLPPRRPSIAQTAKLTRTTGETEPNIRTTYALSFKTLASKGACRLAIEREVFLPPPRS